MAIKLKVRPYCANCCNFESEVTAPEKYYTDDIEVFMSDTIICCKNARRCEAIERYLVRTLLSNDSAESKED